MDVIELIKEFEGCKLNAYLDGGGVPTIGFGTTIYKDGTKVKIGDIMSLAAAENELMIHCVGIEKKIKALLKVPQNKNQMNALISFVYNIGINGFKKSTLLTKINLGRPEKEIEAQFMRWNKDNGKVVNGLTNRRKKESELYLKKPI